MIMICSFFEICKVLTCNNVSHEFIQIVSWPLITAAAGIAARDGHVTHNADVGRFVIIN